MIKLFIFLIAALCCVCVALFFREHVNIHNIFIACAIIFITGVAVTLAYIDITPSAMDLHQHKAVMKYTVIEDKKVDSVFVYRKK